MRKQRWPLAALIAAFFGVAALIYVGLHVRAEMERLRSAQSDNNTWAISQLEVDILKFERSLLLARDGGNLAKVRTQGEVLLSRLDVLAGRQAELADLALAASWQGIQRIYAPVSAVVDLTDDELRARLPELENEVAALGPQARDYSLASLMRVVKQTEATRRQLEFLLSEFLVGSVLLIGLLIFCAWLMAILLDRLRERTEASDRNIAMLERLIEASLDAIVVTDGDGTILRFNNAAEAIFDYSAQEAIGKSAHTLLVPTRLHNFSMNSAEGFLRTGTSALVDQGRVIVSAKRKNGGELPIELAVISGRDGSKKPVFFAIMRDVSERINTEMNLKRARDAALRNEEAKTRFLGIVSHEMRTPLNGLVAALDIVLQTTRVTRKQSKFLTIARDCCSVALDQIEDLLELTRLSARDDDQADIVAFNLHALLSEIVQQSEPLATRRGNVISLSAPGRTVVGNRRLLMRVLMNLIGNAIKFTSEGSVTIRAQVHDADDGLMLHVEVQDTGIGVPVADHERIFQDFEMVEAGYRRSPTGTGLGLGIAKRAVERLGGKIGLSSKEGEGSTFWFTAHVLPAPTDALDLADASRATDAERLAEAQLALSVLIVEDSEVNRIVLREMLESLGHRVDEAHSGQEAAAHLRKARFDLVFMDVSMPVLDGVAATRQIRSEGLAPDTPIIGLTAFASRSEEARFIEAGMQKVLAKPLSFDTLREFMGSPQFALGIRPAPPVEVDAGHEIDEARIIDLRDVLGPTLFPEAWDRFVAEAHEILSEVSAALGDARLEAVAKLAHKGIGTAGAFGAVDLRARMRDIEANARDGRLRDIDRDLLAAQAALRRLEAHGAAWR